MTTAPKVEDSVVAVYDSHERAEAAVKALQQAGLDMKRLSIIGRDFHTEEHALGFYTTGDRMQFWGTRAAFWGGLWGMLFGSAFFLIPGIGPLVVMGPLVGWIAGALEGAAVGGAAGVVAAALASIGVPKDSVVKYETAVKAGQFVVVAHGTTEMIVHARVVLEGTGASLLDSHLLIAQAARDAILKLLADEEVSRVATAETGRQLSDGEEYLDLEALEQGVRRAQGLSGKMANLLPRRAVRAVTWTRILAQLSAEGTAAPSDTLQPAPPAPPQATRRAV